MQAEVDMMGEDFLNAYDAVFDAPTGIATLSFHTTDSVLIYGMLDAYTTTANVLASGQEAEFYTTSPTSDECFFEDCYAY
jgi:hypothetical protein